MKERIGIFGGTFNPVHYGHLVMAQDAYEQLELRQLLFVPCAYPPHKSIDSPVSGEHRAAMLEYALEGDFRFGLWRGELQRGGVSYTVDTVEELRRQYPGSELWLLIGADMIPALHTWRALDRLRRLCCWAVFPRPGEPEIAPPDDYWRLPPEFARRLAGQVIGAHPVGISSTDIRGRVAEGLGIRYLVPPPVVMYISEHRLYV